MPSEAKTSVQLTACQQLAGVQETTIKDSNHHWSLVALTRTKCVYRPSVVCMMFAVIIQSGHRWLNIAKTQESHEGNCVCILVYNDVGNIVVECEVTQIDLLSVLIFLWSTENVLKLKRHETFKCCNYKIICLWYQTSTVIHMNHYLNPISNGHNLFGGDNPYEGRQNIYSLYSRNISRGELPWTSCKDWELHMPIYIECYNAKILTAIYFVQFFIARM